MRPRLTLRLAPVLLAVAACDPGATGGAPMEDAELFGAAEWTKIMTMAPLPEPPPDPTNRYADDPRAAAFGQRLFFEKGYAGPIEVAGPSGNPGERGKVSCATCHDGQAYFLDERAPNNVSHGVGWTPRNSPALANVAYYRWFSWAGKQDSLWMQGANSPESPENFGGNRLEVAHVIFQKYRADYDAVFPVPLDRALDPAAPDAARFPPSGKPKPPPPPPGGPPPGGPPPGGPPPGGPPPGGPPPGGPPPGGPPDGPWERMAPDDREIINTIMANWGKAIAAYERRLLSRSSPLERYVLGDRRALSAAAKRGLKLFIGKAACDACHKGPIFTDNEFHVTGVPQLVGAHVPASDTGRLGDVPKLLTNTFNGAGKFSDDPAAGAQRLAGLAAGTPSDQGKFRTKNLMNIALTGPYMHNGSLATLEDVVHFYNLGGGEGDYAGTKDPKIVPLLLTEAEERDLVAFLRALTGEAVAGALREDTSAK